MGLPTITQRHPPMGLDVLVKCIQEFPNLPGEAKTAFIMDLVKVHPLLCIDWGTGHRFRRARIIHPGERPAGVNDVIWRKDVPPIPGRANPEGKSIFYLADKRDTAFQEIGADQQWVVVAEFIILPGHSVTVCPVGEMLQIQRTGRGTYTGECSSAIEGMLNACSHSEARSLLMADAFLHKMFVLEGDHQVSSCVATSIFNKLKPISAIAYGSYRQWGASNWAVRTEDFWNHWGLCSVTRGLACHLGMGFFKLQNITRVVGITRDGVFRWQDSSDEEESVILLGPPFVPSN